MSTSAKNEIKEAGVASGAKGIQLEELLRNYFWQAGYFVVRGLPFRLEGDDVTDIDLWMYERPAAATRRRIIVDVKNKKSPKAAERIIWASGLQAALRVDSAIVATTDRRPSSRRLAKALRVSLFDGDAINKLAHSELARPSQLSSEEMERAVKKIDSARRSAEWRQTIFEARSSLLSGIGIQSANQNLVACGFFADQAITAYRGSDTAATAVRLFYQCAAMAAISLDYVLSDLAFRSHDERRASIISGIRFGHTEPAGSTPPSVRAAVALARQYAENGASIAKQIEYGFATDADRIPAEIISDHVVKIGASDTLFNIAREVERASGKPSLPAFDALSVDAKSLIGVFLDFNQVAREAFAEAWKPSDGPLFKK